jgi:hypothetical protein
VTAGTAEQAEVQGAESAGQQGEQTRRSRSKGKRKLKHWFNVEELEMARRAGGAVLIAYCGRAKKCGGSSEVVNVIGGLMAESKPSDCKACVRNYEAHLRRELARNERLRGLNG